MGQGVGGCLWVRNRGEGYVIRVDGWGCYGWELTKTYFFSVSFLSGLLICLV